LTSGLGTGETESPDWLSVLLFDTVYIDRLLDIGYHDARRRHNRIEEFLEGMEEGNGKGTQRLEED
jgi:NTE family protein